jgi:hypothetical protein
MTFGNGGHGQSSGSGGKLNRYILLLSSCFVWWHKYILYNMSSCSSTLLIFTAYFQDYWTCTFLTRAIPLISKVSMLTIDS